MPTIKSATPGIPILDHGSRPTAPDHMIARFRRAFRLESVLPVVSVVNEEMLTLAPQIDVVTVRLKYPYSELPVKRLDMFA